MFGIKIRTKGSLVIDIDKEIVDAECPKCKTMNKVTVKQIRLGETINCRSCNETMRLIDKEGSAEKTRKEILRATKDLDKTFKNIGK